MASKPDAHDFLVPQHVWEAAVFANAIHFRVVRFIADGSSTFESLQFKRWPDARRVAETEERSLIYAVTDRGRSVCLVKARWDEFTTIWRKYHPKPRSNEDATQRGNPPDRPTRRRADKGKTRKVRTKPT